MLKQIKIKIGDFLYYDVYVKLVESFSWNCLIWEKTKIRYHDFTGKFLDYRDPKDLNEKLLWLTRYWQHPIKTQCADKFYVREYVAKKGLSHILVPLIGVWENEGEIDFNSLPEKFVLKCNHGCGCNIICSSKEALDKEDALKKLTLWMNTDYSQFLQEIHYKNIPRKIVCEQLLDNKEAPMEYQVWCVNGKADSFLACRKNWDGSYDSWSYSLNWERLYDRIRESDVELSVPKNKDEIIQYAECLSEGIPFLRADFYEVQGKVYFAEMTFTPAGNILSSYKPEFLVRLGNKLILPAKYK